MKSFNKVTKRAQPLVILLLALMPIWGFGQVQLTLPDTTLQAGEEIEVPVYVTGMPKASGVVSGQFEFSYNSTYFDITGINKVGTLLESVGNVSYFEGTQRLAFASTDTVSGDGVLIKLKVKARDDAGYFRQTTLAFSSAGLNEGNPAVTTNSGTVRTEGVRISPKNNIRITKGDTLQFSLTEDVTNPITWSVSDNNIASIDANGQLIANTTGTIRVKGVDATGLEDSTSFFKILPNTFSDLTISVPDTSIMQTLYLELPIRSSDLTGLDVTSAEFDISFSNSYLSLEEVIPGPMVAAWANPTVNMESNRVQIAAAGTDTLAGSGVLYILKFKASKQNYGNSVVSFNKAKLNEDFSADKKNGQITLLKAPEIHVFPADTAVSIGNSLTFNVVGGNGTAPYLWESSNPGVAGIDASTGVLTGVARGDVIIHAKDAENFPSDEVRVRVNDFDAYLDTVQLHYPDTVEVGLFTKNLSSYSIFAYETKFEFDTTRLQFIGLETGGTQSEAANFNVQARDSADFIKVAAAGTSTLSGTEPIIKFRFAPKADAHDGDSLKLDLKYLNLNEASPAVPTTTAIPGLITIKRIYPPVAPTLTSPADNSTTSDTSVSFLWANLSEADSYEFQISADDQFNTITESHSLTATTVKVDSLSFSTTYYWRVAGVNQGGQGDWSQTWSFNTGEAPPEAPILILPDDGQTEVDTAVTFLWHHSARADSFLIEVAVDDTFSTLLHTQTVADTTTSLPNFDYLTTYHWRVKAKNLSGSSDWSRKNSFRTREKPNYPPVIVNPLGSVTLDEDFTGFKAATLTDVFSDPEAQPLTFEIVRYDTLLIRAELQADSLFLHSVENAHGTGAVVIKAMDDIANEVMDTLQVTVQPVNDVPIITAIPDTISFKNDEDFVIRLDTSVSDVEDQLKDLTIALSVTPTDILLTYDKDTYTATLTAPGFEGEGVLSIEVTDTEGAKAQASIVVIVEMAVSNEEHASIPDEFSLKQNFPNPFNPTTNIRYDIAEPTEVRIEVFSMLGQKVATLVNKHKPAGSYTFTFDAAGLSSGLYIYRIQAGSFVQTKKMTLIK